MAAVSALVLVPWMVKFVCGTTVFPGVKVSVQLPPGGTLAQVFPVSIFGEYGFGNKKIALPLSEECIYRGKIKGKSLYIFFSIMERLK